MSVYKNEEGRQDMVCWYDRFLGLLEHPYSFQQVATSFGHTNVLCTGPEDAPVLVCFHGAMGSAPSALSQVQPLIPHFRILFPDTVGQPGRSAETSLSMRGDVLGRWGLEVIDGLGLDQVGLFGASMGGYIAQKVAIHAPERVRAMTLWVPGGLVNGKPWESTKLVVASMFNYLFPSEARMRGLYDKVFTEYDEIWYPFYRDSMRYLKMDRRMPEMARNDTFQAVEAPVQLIAHERDIIFPAEALIERARALFGNLADHDTIPEFKHVPPFDPVVLGPTLDRIRDFQLGA